MTHASFQTFVLPYAPLNPELPYDFWFDLGPDPFEEPDDEASNPRIMEPAR